MSDIKLSNWFGARILQAYLTAPPAPLYLALHLQDPTVLGLTSTELASVGYLRQRITFTAPSAKTVASANSQTFIGLANAVITFLGVWDGLGAVGSHFLFAVPLSPGIGVLVNGHFLVTTGDVAITL